MSEKVRQAMARFAAAVWELLGRAARALGRTA